MTNMTFLMRSLLLTILATALMFSCGDAGFQIIVGDDYVQDLLIIAENGTNDYSSTDAISIQETLDEYGSELLEAEIGDISLTLRDYTDPANNDSFRADVDINFGGTILQFDNVDFSSGTTVTFSSTQLADIINSRSGSSLNFTFDLISESPFADTDDNFILEFNSEIFLTIKAD